MVKPLVIALVALVAAPAAYFGGQAAVSGKNEAPTTTSAKTLPLEVASANGKHKFRVETAKTQAEQSRGLMYRASIPKDGGMLFAPYPAEGGGPREASFWMKNTPSPLDIIFIRPDHTIARIAENTVPFSETPVASGEPVSAVLEIAGGRSAELGITEGDKVSWGK